MKEITLHNPFTPDKPPEIFIFDLDGTLAASKQAMTPEMAETLCTLLTQGKIIAVISGGAMPQYEKQFLSIMKNCPEKTLNNLYLLPTSGAAMLQHNPEQHSWEKIYAESLSPEQHSNIISVLENLDHTIFDIPNPSEAYGAQIEDRETQITMSAWGQNAPYDIKSTWDIDHKKRIAIIREISPLLPNAEMNIGGTSSIDITMPGIDKAHGITRFLEETKGDIATALFIGDALFEGGNDAEALKTGIAAHRVANEKETLEYLQKFL